MRITTLSENTAIRGDFLAEWGLSLLVETGGVTVLLDTGRGVSAGYNADTLGIDLNRVDMVVLSHGHNDHTGGLRDVLRRIHKKVPVTAHPDIWVPKYARSEGEAARYIGIPFQRRELEYLGAAFNMTREPVKLAAGIMTTGEIPMTTPFEEIDPDLFVSENGGWQPDRLRDDQALIITTDAGLVVVLGCAHRGIINTLEYAQQLTGVDRIHAVLGGAHLTGATEERLWLTIAALQDLDVRRLGLCHCTGQAATAVLAREFGERFFFNNVGSVIEFP